jgi:thioredoxin-like negative regulator of GroEL
MESQDPYNKSATLFYFTTPGCNVCKALLPKVSEMLSIKFPKLKLRVVDVASNRETAGKYQVFTVPVVLVYFEGREFIRKVRNFSIQELEREIERPYELFFH